jgi:hypothetical protein
MGGCDHACQRSLRPDQGLHPLRVKNLGTRGTNLAATPPETAHEKTALARSGH